MPARAAAQGLQRARGFVQRAQHQQRLACGRGCTRLPAFGQNARSQPQPQQRGSGEQRMQQRDGARKVGQAQQQQHRGQCQRSDADCGSQPLEFRHAGVTPGRAIRAETGQRRHPDHHCERSADPENVRQIGRRIVAQQAEAEGESQQPRQCHGEGVEQHHGAGTGGG
ncbi:hypothetical protein GALL_517270 [mine drainage metagenome]|uniref:Uncharacterized protein n=1 Tax=mine drainage metagenome TaxID=410659 RepID=A0A1J5PFV6_9ZZZZ